MKRSFTQQDIEKFIKDFRSLPNPYELEKVHQLLNNPNATARHTVKLNSKPFNFIIMTSAIVIGLSALLFWSSPKKAVSEVNSLKKPDVVKELIYDSVPVEKIPASDYSGDKDPVIKHAIASKPGISPKIRIDSGLYITTEWQEIPKLSPNTENAGIAAFKINAAGCIWAQDTVIEKKLLLLDLTNSELKEIGIIRLGSEIYYHNIIEGRYDWAFYTDQIPEEEKVPTHNKFYVAFITNTQFEPIGSGNFYSSMDTLVPVVINDSGRHILWFTPDAKFFSLLPERYNYLSQTYKNLVCLKKKYPSRTFTNYLEGGKERVLDPVNVLNLSKSSLQKIGINIEEESVTFQTVNKHYSLKICKKGTYSTGNGDDSNIFPPNPYPVIMTDTLGRQVYTEGCEFNEDSVSKSLKILVPVRVNIHNYVSTNYEVIICWYYPTEAFLRALPGNMGTDLKSELLTIANGTKASSSSCNYFEECKSSLILDDFKLYPNPASGSVTLEFQNSEEIIGSVSIVNMAGLKLRVLLPDTQFLSGHNSYKMNLSGISPGIYLISVNTQKGFKTRRLIVTQ
jgi:hypothetical protein